MSFTQHRDVIKSIVQARLPADLPHWSPSAQRIIVKKMFFEEMHKRQHALPYTGRMELKKMEHTIKDMDFNSVWFGRFI